MQLQYKRIGIAALSTVEVKTFAEASRICRDYIESEGLGSREWHDAHILDNGKKIARISYNCRVWTPDGKPLLSS